MLGKKKMPVILVGEGDGTHAIRKRNYIPLKGKEGPRFAL